MLTTVALSLAAGILLGFAAGFLAHRYLARRTPAAVSDARARRGDADREARGIIREAEIQARAEVLKAREAFDASVKEQRREMSETLSGLNKREQSLTQREENMDRKADVLDRREDAIEKKAAAAEAAAEEAKRLRKEADALRADADGRLERLAGMTREQARKDLSERAQRDIQADLAVYLRREHERAEKDARRTAQKIVLEAMQRYAGSHAAETMTRSVTVPGGDEVKGRIIGREGRNIRALEAATGCSILVDDTPDAVVVSAADPLRREIAAVALERLLASGRIQPQRIEETVESVRQNFDERLLEIGGAAAAEADVALVDPEEIRTLGRLQFRTSFSQNVLRHSVEVARYAGMMAAELGLDPATARRVGLLHDIGKALDETASGPHAIAGAEFLRKRGEPREVTDGVAGHHGETEETTLYATLASVADALSSARPGARSESNALYVERIEGLERLAASFPGVSRAFAVQAGRDLRVLVDPDKTTDEDAMQLAARLAARIEQEQQFPGQVRVTVIREKRCVEYAR